MSKKHPAISLGEGLAIVANLGVVLGLIFVWVELRQSQTQLRADVELSLAASYQEVLSRASENEHLAELTVIAYQNPASLTPTQYLQLMAVHAEWMAIVYATYELWQSGAIAEETWELHSNYYLFLLQTEWMQQFWREMHHEGMYPDEFMESLESRLPAPNPSIGQ
ncbi:MAG: hypothetical protein QNI99_01810 [Woeseiaceae bacterium]|nr:hypothetical protein [Woeseiaceae bacterium]